MSIIADELEWALNNEQEALDTVKDKLNLIELADDFSFEHWHPKLEDAFLINERLIIEESLNHALFFFKQAELLMVKKENSVSLPSIAGDAVFENSVFRGAVKISGNNLLFDKHNKVEFYNVGIQDKIPALEINLGDLSRKKCTLEIGKDSLLFVRGQLKININGSCVILIEGILNLEQLYINQLSNDHTSSIIFSKDSKIIFTTPELNSKFFLRNVDIINYGSLHLSNSNVTGIRSLNNFGLLTFNNANVFAQRFYNKNQFLLGNYSAVLVKDYFCNLGQIQLQGYNIILNSFWYHDTTIHTGRTIPPSTAYMSKSMTPEGLFFNKGDIFSIDQPRFLSVMRFRFVINGLEANIDTVLHVETITQPISGEPIYKDHGILNLGGMIKLRDKSVVKGKMLLNYPTGPKIEDNSASTIFEGETSISIDAWIYNYESYFGSISGKIKFLKAPTKILCHSAVKSCTFEGHIISNIGEIDGRDLRSYSKKIAGEITPSQSIQFYPLTISSDLKEDLSKRIEKLSRNKVIPLHHMFNDNTLAYLENFNIESQDESPEMESQTKSECIKRFSFVIPQTQDKKQLPGMAELLCNLDSENIKQEYILCDGYTLDKFLTRYEKEIFGRPLDVFFSNKLEKMSSLLGTAKNVDLNKNKLLEPLAEETVVTSAMIWPVKVKNKNNLEIIVPYLYPHDDFNKYKLRGTNFIFHEHSLAKASNAYLGTEVKLSVVGNVQKLLGVDNDEEKMFRTSQLKIDGTLKIEKKGGLVLDKSYLPVSGKIINKGIITSIGLSILQTKERFEHFGQIVGHNLQINAKVFFARLLINGLHQEQTAQLISESTAQDLRIINNNNNVEIQRPTIDLEGTLIIDIEDLLHIEPSKITAKEKIYVRSKGKIFILPVGLLTEIHSWWGGGHSTERSIDFLTTTLESANIEIVSEDDCAVFSTKFLGDTTLYSKSGLLLDVVANIKEKISTSTHKKRGFFKSKITSTREYIQQLVPIMNEFHGSLSATAEKNLFFTGIKTEGRKAFLRAGTENQEAELRLLQATQVYVHDFTRSTKTKYVGFTYKKRHEIENTESYTHILNIVKTEKGFYGRSSGKWIQVATKIDGDEIVIAAKDDIILKDVQDIFHYEKRVSEKKLAAWASMGRGEASIGVGFQGQKVNLLNTRFNTVSNIFNATTLASIRSNKTVYSFGTFFNTTLLDIDAENIVFDVGEDTEYFSASSLFYRIGINAGVQFTPAAAVNAAEELCDQDLDSNLGKVNAAFAAVKVYTMVGRLVEAIATGGISALFSAGAWVGFSMHSSREKMHKKRAVPTIIHAKHISLKASRNISMKATQMFVFDAYIKAKTLKIDPGQMSVQRKASGKSIGFTMGVGLSDMFGEKVGRQMSDVLDTLKVGRIPVGDYLPTFTLGKNKGEEVRIIPTNIQVSGTFKIDIEVEATIRGANIEANKLFACFDKLILESVHDVVKNKGWSASAGLSIGSQEKLFDWSKQGDVLKSVTGGFNKEKDFFVNEVTKLVGHEEAIVVVSRALHLHGAMIANAEKNEKGEYTDKGKLILEVGDLFIKHLYSCGKGVIIKQAYNFLNHEMEASREFGYKDKSGIVEAIIGRGNFTVKGSTYGDPVNRNVDNVNHREEVTSRIKTFKGYYATDIPPFDKFGSNFAKGIERLGEDLLGFPETLEGSIKNHADNDDFIDEDLDHEKDDIDAERNDIDEEIVVDEEEDDYNDKTNNNNNNNNNNNQDQKEGTSQAANDISEDPTTKTWPMCTADNNEPQLTRFNKNEQGNPQVRSYEVNQECIICNTCGIPKIKFYARTVVPNLLHGYTIYEFSNGRQIIVTGFPEEHNPLRNLQAEIVEYKLDNVDSKIPKGDWDISGDRRPIQEWHLENDQDLERYLSIARNVVAYFNTGNNGGRFDYDICLTHKCSGGNSNTLQGYLYREMNLNLKLSTKLLPGIDGKLYVGPLDDFLRNYGRELQKEQP